MDDIWPMVHSASCAFAQITVNQKERTLKISGEKKRAAEFDKATNGDEQQQKFRRQFERRVGKFQRIFSMIPDNADLSAVSARYSFFELLLHI